MLGKLISKVLFSSSCPGKIFLTSSSSVAVFPMYLSNCRCVFLAVHLITVAAWLHGSVSWPSLCPVPVRSGRAGFLKAHFLLNITGRRVSIWRVFCPWSLLTGEGERFISQQKSPELSRACLKFIRPSKTGSTPFFCHSGKMLLAFFSWK